ncbi:MAG: phage tail protein [Bacteroidetes bacterium]|nr:phage tail protein [Bacteroidota bacterium]
MYAFAGTEDKIPEGWLLCDGRSFATNVYPALYSAIGGAWGFQEGGDLLALDSFNIPDLRGMFLRGVSGNSGNDPDTLNRTYSRPGGNEYNKVGSIQKDAIQNHLHYRSMSHSSEWCWTPPPPTGNGLGWNEYSVQQQPNYTSGDINIEAVPGGGGSARVSAESRPVNVYVIYIIKYR